VEPTLLPPRESLLGEPRKTASLLFMSIGAQAQFGFDICGAGSRSLKEKEAWPQNRRPKNEFVQYFSENLVVVSPGGGGSQ